MRARHLAFVIAALAACDTDELDGLHSPAGYTPDVVTGQPVSAPDGWTDPVECEAPHPQHCKPGYIRAIASDVTIVRCQHMDGCSYSSDPCVYGVPVGDATRVVVCVSE